ncbi:MAG: hypothetical protein WCA26_04675 [Xanthobacteraceae bacterium]
MDRGDGAQIRWEIDPEEMTYPTIHGLRGAGILIRRAAGHDVD